MLCDAFLTMCLAYRFARRLDYNTQNQIDSLYKFILETNPGMCEYFKTKKWDFSNKTTKLYIGKYCH